MSTVTSAVSLISIVPFTVARTTLVPGTDDRSAPLATPSSPVGSPGCTSVFPLPLALSVTVAPATGAPDPSRTVTVIVDVSLAA